MDMFCFYELSVLSICIKLKQIMYMIIFFNKIVPTYKHDYGKQLGLLGANPSEQNWLTIHIYSISLLMMTKCTGFRVNLNDVAFITLKRFRFLHSNCRSRLIYFLSLQVSELYSTVDKSVMEEEKEHDYSSISEIRGIVVESSSSELYATVRDVYPSPPAEQPVENTDHGYETIKIAKGAEDETQQDNGLMESDYANVGELELNSEMSRL